MQFERIGRKTHTNVGVTNTGSHNSRQAAIEEARFHSDAAGLAEEARKLAIKIWPYTTGRTKQGKWTANKSNANLPNWSSNIKRIGPARVKSGLSLAITARQIGYKGGRIANWNLANRKNRAYQIINGIRVAKPRKTQLYGGAGAGLSNASAAAVKKARNNRSAANRASAARAEEEKKRAREAAAAPKIPVYLKYALGNEKTTSENAAKARAAAVKAEANRKAAAAKAEANRKEANRKRTVEENKRKVAL